MNPTPLLPISVELVIAAVLGVIPLAALLIVRSAHPRPRPRLSIVRMAALYALLVLVLALGTLVDDLPMAFGLLGVILGLMGLGIGVASVYRFLYGDAWLAEHPEVVRRDTARWERAALLLALASLLAAVIMALQLADVAQAIG